MSRKPYKPREAMSLEDAVSATVTDLGGFPAVADMPGIRVGRSTLFRYADNADENRAYVIPLDIAAFLTTETLRRGHEPHLLRWLQEQCQAGRVHMEPHESLVDLVARLGKESGEAFCALGKALKATGDGGAAMTPRERNELLAELRDVQRVAAAGIAVLQAGDTV